MRKVQTLKIQVHNTNPTSFNLKVNDSPVELFQTQKDVLIKIRSFLNETSRAQKRQVERNKVMKKLSKKSPGK